MPKKRNNLVALQSSSQQRTNVGIEAARLLEKPCVFLFAYSCCAGHGRFCSVTVSLMLCQLRLSLGEFTLRFLDVRLKLRDLRVAKLTSYATILQET